MLRIALYNPLTEYCTMPLGLLAIASVLDRDVFDVVIVDARLSPDPHQEMVLASSGALCVGITVLTGRTIEDALSVSRLLKKHYPDLPVVWGGWHPSIFPCQTLAEASVDYAVEGQGERTFQRLVESLADHRSPGRIPGLTYRDGRSRIVRNPPRQLEDVNAFPPVRYEFLQVEKYFSRKGKRQIDYISSMGCPFRCAFCADPYVYGRKWSGLQPEQMLDHLVELMERYQFEDVNFQDETFFVDRERCARFAEGLLSKNLNHTWAATMRADQCARMPEDYMHLFKRSGLRRLLIGVESGSPAIIRKINKDTTLEQIIQSAERCRQHDLAVYFSFIVGFPGETELQMKQTLALAQRLKAMSRKFRTPVFLFKAYPGSKIALDAVQELPTTLEEWANFDYVEARESVYVNPAMQQLIDAFRCENEQP